MKKTKVLSGLIMLILCIAVIGMGIYAITPTAHGIQATVSVTQGGKMITMKAYLGEKLISNTITPRHETQRLVLNTSALVFDVQDVYEPSEVDPIDVKIAITNHASEAIGAYIVEAPVAEGEQTKISNIATYKNFHGKIGNDPVTDVVKATFIGSTELDGYTKIEPGATDYIICSLQLLKIEDTQIDVEMKLNIRIETDISEPILAANSLIYNEDRTVVLGCSDKSILKSVIVPDSVLEISADAFSGCTNLTTIILPNGLKTIGDRAFYQSGITSITIPASVESMGRNLFADAATYMYCKLTELNLSKGLTTIGEGAFVGTQITSITIPSTVKIVHNSAFACSPRLSQVYISSGVETIGDSAFDKGAISSTIDVALSYISIPASVTSWGSNCIFQSGFANGVTTIEYTDNFSAYESIYLAQLNFMNYSRTSTIYVPAGQGEAFRTYFSSLYDAASGYTIGNYLASKVRER